VDREAVQLNMKGLLAAADALEINAPLHGVPLFAILESYSPRIRQFGELDIEREGYKRKLEHVLLDLIRRKSFPDAGLI